MAEQDDFLTISSPQLNGQDDQPMAGMISQYIKDLSFENPSAPAIFQNTAAPQIDVQFGIGAAQVGEEVHEVVLSITVKSQQGEQAAFVVELAYGALFGLRNIPAEHVQPFLLAEGPRLMFPFARRIVADAVRDGGFPPLMLEPIDFLALYQQQLQQNGQPAGQA